MDKAAAVRDPGSLCWSTARVRVKLRQVNARRRRPSGLSVLGDDSREDTTADKEFRGETHEAGRGRLHQIAENAIGDRFVERAFVAIRPDVELEALQLDAGCIRDVVQIERCEVGLSGLRA